MKQLLAYWGPMCAIIGTLITGTLAWSNMDHRVALAEDQIETTEEVLQELTSHLQEEREARRRMEHTLCLVCESIRGETKCPRTCKEY